MVLLRGYLYIDIIEAANLPDCDTAFFNIAPKDFSDPFVQVKIGSCILCKTAWSENDLSPIWQAEFRIPVCHFAFEIQIQVLDKDYYSEGVLGEMSIHGKDLLDGKTLEGWYPLSGCDGRIRLKIKYIPTSMLKATFEVPDCYFPLREGCKVTLYQDAHCPALPMFENIKTSSGEAYKAPSAWTDLYKALKNAQRFIYITGWSVFTETVLVREEFDCKEAKGETVGNLLKQKAEEGVRVLIMVWDEKMSTDITAGLMGTHDEESMQYFEGSHVEFAVVPRIRSLPSISYWQEQFVETCYSHHQKTVVVDVPPVGVKELPRLQAFIGGLDITNGRYDTPAHELYKTLTTVHAGDFYNGCADTTSEFGPRQPWHDIHCRVDGPLAQDVLGNFVERWRNQVKEREDRLLPIDADEFVIDAPVACKEELAWNTQLFRSITSDSALFDFDRISTIPKIKGKYVDDSIHRAYIHHIRKADGFIFIENQYFLGSAYGWEDEQTTKAHHLIPLEITHRIVENISAKEYFGVYVIVPMFPEGDPTSGAVQEMLHWQYRTMQMMYDTIAKAIEANKLDTHPRDYLSFFCLGKAECPEEVPKELPLPEPDTPAYLLREKARFMIYVHSKMMIVDDNYIMVGSANINQRSMGGTRDSEIAVGAFQPLQSKEVAGVARGEIHDFRMALWAEHLGGVDETHIDPGTIECMRAVNKLADSNWSCYAADGPCKTKGHLMRYPVEVLQDGTVTALKGSEKFPDTEAPVLGDPKFLPNKLTT